MEKRNLWTDSSLLLPKPKNIVVGGEITLRESDPVFIRATWQNGDEFCTVARYRKAIEKTGGKSETVDEYWIGENESEYQTEQVKAWMYPPKPDAIDADWLIEQMNGDCDYCEHLTNLRDNSPCMNCIHAPVGSILPDETTKNNWTITKTYRPSIEERTVYPG